MTKLEYYIDRKICMLREEFLLELTDDDICRLEKCKTEYEADRVGRAIINRELADWY